MNWPTAPIMKATATHVSGDYVYTDLMWARLKNGKYRSYVGGIEIDPKSFTLSDVTLYLPGEDHRKEEVRQLQAKIARLHERRKHQNARIEQLLAQLDEKKQELESLQSELHDVRSTLTETHRRAAHTIEPGPIAEDRTDGIKSRLAAVKRELPYEEADRHAQNAKAWSDLYQHAPTDLEWLLAERARAWKEGWKAGVLQITEGTFSQNPYTEES